MPDPVIGLAHPDGSVRWAVERALLDPAGSRSIGDWPFSTLGVSGAKQAEAWELYQAELKKRRLGPYA